MTFLLALCFFFFFFFWCFGLGFGVFALSQKARIWEEDDVMTPVTFCSNCTPLLFNASLRIDLERTSSKVVTPLDNGCGLTILAILFFFSLCVSKKSACSLCLGGRGTDYALLGCGSWINLLFFFATLRCRAGMGRWAVSE